MKNTCSLVFLNAAKGLHAFIKRLIHGWDFTLVTDDKFEFHTHYVQNIDSEIYIFTTENAPNGKIVKFDAGGNPCEHNTVIPESENPLIHTGISWKDICGIWLMLLTGSKCTT
jgi:hypothetical protein